MSPRSLPFFGMSSPLDLYAEQGTVVSSCCELQCRSQELGLVHPGDTTGLRLVSSWVTLLGCQLCCVPQLAQQC